MSGPFGDGEAHVGEDLDHLVEHLADGVDAPILQRPGAHGQRHVGLLAGEAGRERAALQLGLAAFQRLADARLEAVDRLPEGLALVARQGAQRRHQLRDASLLAERGDAHALDRRQVGGSRDLGGERALEGGEVGCSVSSVVIPAGARMRSMAARCRDPTGHEVSPRSRRDRCREGGLRAAPGSRIFARANSGMTATPPS